MHLPLHLENVAPQFWHTNWLVIFGIVFCRTKITYICIVSQYEHKTKVFFTKKAPEISEAHT